MLAVKMYIKEKNIFKRITLLMLSLTLFFVSSWGMYRIYTSRNLISPKENSQILGTVDEKENPGLPIRLAIPTIKVNAYIQYLGVNDNGEMDVPDNSYDVGWFEPGSRPGEMGSAVIAGHLDGKNGEAGIFAI